MYYIVVTPFFPSPESWRGAYVLDQVKAIQRNSDYDILVFHPQNSSYKEESYTIEGIKVFRFHFRSSPSFLFNGIFNSSNEKRFIKAFRRVFGTFTSVVSSQIAFVHCHTSPYAIYGFALKKLAPQAKVLVQHHDLDPFSIRTGFLAHWKPNALFRAKNTLDLINRADLNICISTPCKNNLLAFPKARPDESYQGYLQALRPLEGLPHITNKNIYILYNGVDTSIFSPKNKGDSIYRIGCISNFQDIKSHITLIKAFEVLIKDGHNNMRLSLLGSGETRPMCEDYIRSHALSDYVEWPEEVSHNELPEYYHTLDIFVLPSIFEGFGCVYTEAYACGIPFIGVYNQGAAECIEPNEQDKWLIHAFDYRKLAELITNHYKERYTQHLCKPYDINLLISQYLRFICSL